MTQYTSKEFAELLKPQLKPIIKDLMVEVLMEEADSVNSLARGQRAIGTSSVSDSPRSLFSGILHILNRATYRVVYGIHYGTRHLLRLWKEEQSVSGD